MANEQRIALIQARAKEMFPKSEELQNAFVKGAVWNESSYWRKVTDEKPEEGSVVFAAYNYHRDGDGIHMDLNIAKFKDSKFESYTDSNPDLWCYPPLPVEKEN